MVMDVTTDIRASEREMLELYCDWTASAVGRLSVRIVGLDTCVGEALQLTNIQRDLDGDAMLDRLYLPRAALIVATVDDDGLDPILSHPDLGRACAAVVTRPWDYFCEADRIMAACPCAAVRAPRLISIANAGASTSSTRVVGRHHPRQLKPAGFASSAAFCAMG